MVTGAILIFIAPLSHIYFPKKNKKVVAYELNLNQKVADIDNQLADNFCDFENNFIEKGDYLLNLHQLNNKKELTITFNDQALQQFAKQHRVFGWSTLRVFLIGFGVRLPYLLLSVIISFLVSKINTRDKYLKNWFFWIQISCYTISFYFMFWVFWTSQDFPLKTYPLFFILFSLLASLATVSFITYKEIFRLKASKRIEKLIVLLITNNKYIESKKNSKKNVMENMEEIEKIIT